MTIELNENTFYSNVKLDRIPEILRVAKELDHEVTFVYPATFTFGDQVHENPRCVAVYHTRGNRRKFAEALMPADILATMQRVM